jgi:hypothetical protein
LFSIRAWEIEDDDRYQFFLDGADDITSREDLAKAFVDRTGITDMEFGDLIWVSKWTPTIRMVDTFGKGRVFVTGGQNFPSTVVIYPF